MKNFKRLLGFVTIMALLFTSCSKEDETVPDNSEMATLSFGTVLNDLVTNKGALKQAIDGIPECSDELPAFVEVVLTGPTNVGSMANPLVVSVNPTPGDYDGDGEDEYFTEESADLELQPGEYTLQFFAVYDGDPNAAGSNMIWVAPTAGGELSDFVNTSLPMDFNLGAGVKKYLDVEVLCFDDRLVNEYGYLFFDIEPNEAFEFCFFANYCDPSGRHFPAAYSVNVWLGNDSSGTLLHSETNTTGIGNPNDPYNENDPYAEPLCLVLPDLAQFEDDEDYLYYEVTLMDWPEVYGQVAETEPITGTLSRNDIQANFNGADGVDYEHLRFCGETPPVVEECDIEGPDAECTEVFLEGESEAWVRIDADGTYPLYQAGSTTGPGQVIVNLDEGNPSFSFYTDSENALDDYVVEISQYGSQTEGRLACISAEDITLEEGDADAEVEFTSQLVYPFYARIKANVCGDVDETTDSDGDGVPDSVDQCPGTPEAFRVDELGCRVYDIEGPDTTCFEAHLEGEEEEWIMISDPSPNFATLLSLEGEEGIDLASVTVQLQDGDWSILINTTEEYQVDDYIIRVWNGNTGVLGWVFSDENISAPADDEPDVQIFQPANLSYPFYVMIKANVCPTE